MPLSEALAARRHVNRPWWRRATQSIETRIPPTLRGRWALSLPAAAAVALVALMAAAAGGWYLTRSQSTVVAVGAANAGEAAASSVSTPDEDQAASGGEPAADAHGRPFGEERDGGCHSRRATSGATAAPTRWTRHGARVVPTARIDAGTSGAKPAAGGAASALPASTSGGIALAAAPARPPSMSPMPLWRRAPIAHRYVEAMVARAARRQSCPPRTAMATTPALGGGASPGSVVVDVEGKVARPGIESLPAGSRVYEAIAAAGGALPGVDVTGLDLARPVTDGEQLRVGIAGAPSPVVGLPQAPVGGRGKRGKPAQPVNLNTATLEQLEAVPDVGPALAQRILDWRSEHGRFESVSQLRQVRGIGDRKFADMRDSVTV